MTKEGTKLVVNKKIFVSIVIAICVVAALLAATTSTTIPVKGSSLKETHSVFWQSNNENYEVRLTAALSCHKNRKTNNGNYFFSTELRKCLLFPNKQGWSELTYLMPPDVTSVPLLDYQTPSAVNSQHQRNGEHSSNVKEKFSPSVHARFLFDDWRLWESELGCQPEVKTTHQASSKHDGPPNSFSQINVSTRGFHNPTLPNNLYQLDNFCIDELGGGLFGFKEAFEKSLAIDRFLGLDEHPYAGNYPDFDRFVHPANHEPVNIVYPSTTTQPQWKTTIAASLEKHFIGKGEVPPEVFFHEDSALIVSLNTQGPENPVHQYHRYATSVALGSILNVSSVLYLMSMAADHPKYHKDRHSSKIFMLENTTLIGKLPSKLLTPAEEHELRNMHQKPKEFDRNLVNMNNVLRLPWFAAAKLPPKPISRGPLDATHIAINEIIGKTQNKFSYYGHHTSASLSGKEGCEFYRCSDLPPKCTAEYRQLHRRCAKPFAVVANTLPLIQRVNMTEVIGNYRFPNHEPFPTFVDYRPDTANYSRVVWSIATTELIKEAKRIKKDILLLKNNRPLSIEGELKIVLQKEISTGLAQLGDYQYIVHWRDRLVRRLASIDQEPLSLKERTTLATEFVEEYFSTLLERNHLMETKGKLGMPWRSQRSQLICYKRAYTSHVFYKTKQKQRQHGKNPRGTLAMLFPANCHSREVLNITYNTIQAKFGMCQTTVILTR